MKKTSDPFGLLAFLHWNHDWNKFAFDEKILPKAVAQIRDLGVGIIRLDILWSDVAEGPLKYNYTRYDSLLNTLEKNGINVLAVLHYNKVQPSHKTEKWNSPPASFEEFAEYVNATVNRYKRSIKHWEIWNEPNHEYYWNGPKDGLKKYSELLKLSYAAAKKADPKAVVLNGGLANPLPEAVRNLYREGGKEIFDILNIHPFINPLLRDAAGEFGQLMREVRVIMDENGDSRKKIWITEMGCPGIPEGEILQPWFGGEGLNEKQQADWLETQYGWIKNHPYVEKIFWAFYRDTDKIFNEGADYLGLVRKDLTPKPAYFRMKKLIGDFHQLRRRSVPPR